MEFLDSRALHNIKVVQDINGRLTTPGRFIARSAEKALPLFHTLKGCVDKNHCEWTKEADATLQHLKEALCQLPTIASPLPGETLQVYLATANKDISSVFTVERNKKRLPIHFVSRTMQGPKIYYPILEKLVLALIYTARRLQSYFQAYKMKVITSLTIN